MPVYEGHEPLDPIQMIDVVRLHEPIKKGFSLARLFPQLSIHSNSANVNKSGQSSGSQRSGVVHGPCVTAVRSYLRPADAGRVGGSNGPVFSVEEARGGHVAGGRRATCGARETNEEWELYDETAKLGVTIFNHRSLPSPILPSWKQCEG